MSNVIIGKHSTMLFNGKKEGQYKVQSNHLYMRTIQDQDGRVRVGAVDISEALGVAKKRWKDKT